jgi:Asp-tRNA(Asn)/Glu-tRNA(Gln) amidotransferase A subunit family amidase
VSLGPFCANPEPGRCPFLPPSGAGLPIGLQVVDLPGHDGAVVALGAAFERASRA